MLKAALSTRAKVVRKAPVQQVVDETPDLARLPIQTHWPGGDAGPLITWPVILTRPPHGSEATDVNRYNAGVYRAQVIGRDKIIMRWLEHRGGAAHHRSWQAAGGEKMPVAIVLGADPATLLSAALPLPETVSELTFAGGVFSGARPRLVPAKTVPLMVPADAEMVIEGWVDPPAEVAPPEGPPFGDHTGYYNPAEPFPVMTVSALTTRENPLYLSTYTGRPPRMSPPSSARCSTSWPCR